MINAPFHSTVRGESLHKRGYRVEQTEAPLNEVLAAGMILKTGWRGESDFIDPMCGSGTLLIEAAMIAMNVPPGIYRQNFAFEKWKNFNAELFETIYNDDSGERVFEHKIYGSDISTEAISIAAKNIKSAGVEKHIDLKVMPFEKYTEAPSEKGILVTNPLRRTNKARRSNRIIRKYRRTSEACVYGILSLDTQL